MEMSLNANINLAEMILGFLLIISSFGVITIKNPVHASLSFLSALMMLAMIYVELSSEFIGIMQVLVYAGAILVIFMFVIILFQDAHEKIKEFKAIVSRSFLAYVAISFIGSILLLSYFLIEYEQHRPELVENFGTVQVIGEALYLQFFFPFEAVVFLFLAGIIGAFYIGRSQWSS